MFIHGQVLLPSHGCVIRYIKMAFSLCPLILALSELIAWSYGSDSLCIPLSIPPLPVPCWKRGKLTFYRPPSWSPIFATHVNSTQAQHVWRDGGKSSSPSLDPLINYIDGYFANLGDFTYLLRLIRRGDVLKTSGRPLRLWSRCLGQGRSGIASAV